MDNVIERALREKIGRAQWFHRAGVGHEREARDRKDSDTERGRHRPHFVFFWHNDVFLLHIEQVPILNNLTDISTDRHDDALFRC